MKPNSKRWRRARRRAMRKPAFIRITCDTGPFMKHYLEIYGMVVKAMGLPPELVESPSWHRTIRI